MKNQKDNLTFKKFFTAYWVKDFFCGAPSPDVVDDVSVLASIKSLSLVLASLGSKSSSVSIWSSALTALELRIQLVCSKQEPPT